MENLGNSPDRPHGMKKSEIDVLCRTMVENGCKQILEVGMANGSSSTAILQALSANGGGSLTSIDPFQLTGTGDIRGKNDVGYAGKGVANVKAAGFEKMHTLMPEFDYLAMAKLASSEKKFDMVFIDGYHSFDYTFLDFFYADLVLKPGGLVAFHDSAYEAVYRVCMFALSNKPYEVVGPRPEMALSNPVAKARRRLSYLLKGESEMLRKRRFEWCSLTILKKISDKQMPEEIVRPF